MTELTIRHTHEGGTILEGTARGDGSAPVLKELHLGWRWGRSIAAWYVSHSRDRMPKTHVIDRSAAALREAGFTVAVDVETTARPTAEVEAAKAERQQARADRLAERAEARHAAADTAYAKATADGDRLPPGGEPIKVGHHSERGHRAAIDRAHRSMGRWVDAERAAEDAEAAAEAAAVGTAARNAPRTVANRIEKIEADIRRVDRQLEGYTAGRGGPYARQIAPASGAYRDRLQAHRAELVDQRDHWRGVRDEQIASGRAGDYSRDTIAVGDEVHDGWQWRPVLRVNPKSVTVPTDYSWTRTLRYSDLRGHRKATTEQ